MRAACRRPRPRERAAPGVRSDIAGWIREVNERLNRSVTEIVASISVAEEQSRSVRTPDPMAHAPHRRGHGGVQDRHHRLVKLPPPESVAMRALRRAGRRRSRARAGRRAEHRAVGYRSAGVARMHRRTMRSSPGKRQRARQAGRPSLHQLGHTRQDRGGVGAKRVFARRELPGKDAECEHVGRGRRLRRRSVAPEPCIRACRARMPASVSRVCGRRLARRRAPRQAEIENLDLAVHAPDDVLRLQIAMDDAALVRGGERRGDVDQRGDEPVRRQRPIAELVAQRAARGPAPRRCTARRRSPRGQRSWRWPDATARRRRALRASAVRGGSGRACIRASAP